MTKDDLIAKLRETKRRHRSRRRSLEVVAILCSMASAAHALREFENRDQTIEVAAELMQARETDGRTDRRRS